MSLRRRVMGQDGRGKDYLVDLCNNTLQEYNSSEVTKVKPSTFRYATALQRVSLDNCLSVGFFAFDNCTGLMDVNLPKATRFEEQAFSYTQIPSITEETFPALNYIGLRCFRNCPLTEFSKPNTHVSLGGIAFEGCGKLKKVDVLSFVNVEGNQGLLFYNCAALEAFIIRRTDAVNVFVPNGGFQGSSIANGTGYIYVPSALVDSYKAASGWSRFADQIRAIEDYPEITGGLKP